jgi:hypothetical protein
MALLTQSIPNLIGGVSQQAPAIRNMNQCEDMVNAYPSPIEGLMKRYPTYRITEIRNASNTVYSSVSETNSKFHLIQRDNSEKYFVMIKCAASAANCGINIYDLDGTRKTLQIAGNALDYLAGSNKDSLKLLTIADVTFVVNTNIVPTLANTTSTAIDYTKAALIYVKQSNDGRTSKVNFTDSNGSNPFTAEHKSSNTDPGTDHLADQLASDINAFGNGYTASAKDSVVYVTRSSAFLATSEDDYGGQGVVVIRDSVQRFEDLPSTAQNNYVVKVLGSPESGIDDYYVKFEAAGGQTFAKGIWRETVAPAVKISYDPAKMPHVIIRQSDSTFLFKQADGTTPGGGIVPAGADYSSYKWTDRLTGDDTTNSPPSFVGSNINNIILYKNRLGFLSDENIILSETSEFFNFWRTTVMDIPDSDPIDVSSSSPKVGKLKSGIGFNTELILFTDSSQLVLRGGEILSPKSVALLPVGDYDNYSHIQPTSSGLSVYFPFNRGGGYSGVRELIPQPNIDGSYIVNTLTDTVPSYISGAISHVASTTQEDIAAVVSGGNLYLYKYLKNGDSVIQSAWFKYQFPDNSSSGFATVLWAEFTNTNMYLVLVRSNSSIPVLESIKLGTDLNDTAKEPLSNWVCNLDQREYYTAGTYNSTTGLTTWTLLKPYSYIAGKTAVYTVSGTNIPISAGTTYNLGTDTAATVSVMGNYSNTKVWIGINYEMKYQFSQFWLQARSGRGEAALQSGRYQLRNISILFEETSFFKIKVQTGGENNYEYDYSGNIIGSNLIGQLYLSRGTFRVPIYGRNTSTTVTLVNNTPLPCKILSAEIEADYTDRAQRYS